MALSASKSACCLSQSVLEIAYATLCRSGAEGTRFTEATKINTSLLALGNVIQALAEKRSQIPFRDSKLTRLMMDRIGGNCKTSLLVCVSPVNTNSSETLRTVTLSIHLALPRS